ncbi:MAG: TIGR03067 domain-containing protein [Planctomycetes bacterium]|nr:TIGR03067 domain-containing protein [Planctomycetota bacterium]
MRMICVCLLACLLTGASLAGGSDVVKKDLKALQGAWAVEALEFNGKDLAGKHKLTFIFKDDVATIEGDDAVQKEYAKIGFKLDPSTNPKCLDITVAGGVQKDAKIEGIYELKGDELRLCVLVFGNERPTEFKSPGGSSIALLTLKRKK